MQREARVEGARNKPCDPLRTRVAPSRARQSQPRSRDGRVPRPPPPVLGGAPDPNGQQQGYLARPATSSVFSGLLAPGLPLFYALSAVDLLLTPGTMTFRCGVHPVPHVECGFNASRGGGVEGTGEGHGEGWPEGGGGRDGATRGEPGWPAGPIGAEEGARCPPAGTRYGDGAGRGTGPEVGGGRYGAGPGPGPGAGEGARAEGSGVKLADDLAPESSGTGGAVSLEDPRVLVLLNLLAKRGFESQGLAGLTSWLANSTLDMLAPSAPPGPPQPGAFDVAGEAAGEAAGETAPFFFHRVFDAVSGLPMPDPQGNCSSLAAASSVLLALGDGPEGGNDFPPIAHATL